MNDNPAIDDAAMTEFLSDTSGQMICIHGADDDQAVVMVFNDGSKVSDEVFDVLGHDPTRIRLTHSDGAGLDIVLCLLDTGVWAAGFAQLREGTEVPTWPISFGSFDNMAVIMVSVPTMVTVELVSDPDGS